MAITPVIETVEQELAKARADVTQLEAVRKILREGGTTDAAPTRRRTAKQTPDGWKTSEKNGKQFTGAPHRRGVLYRHGNETVGEAIERDKTERAAVEPAA